MSMEKPRSRSASSRAFINLQDHGIMDVRTGKKPSHYRKSGMQFVEPRKMEYWPSFSQGHGGRIFRYFTFESMFLLICLTVSLLILPLVLPPLPPPPFLLLLLPICILALLMILAFMPSNIRDAAYT